MEAKRRVIEVKITFLPPKGPKTDRSGSVILEGDGKLYKSQVEKIISDLVYNLMNTLSDTEVYKAVNGEDEYSKVREQEERS